MAQDFEALKVAPFPQLCIFGMQISWLQLTSVGCTRARLPSSAKVNNIQQTLDRGFVQVIGTRRTDFGTGGGGGSQSAPTIFADDDGQAAAK